MPRGYTKSKYPEMYKTRKIAKGIAEKLNELQKDAAYTTGMTKGKEVFYPKYENDFLKICQMAQSFLGFYIDGDITREQVENMIRTIFKN